MKFSAQIFQYFNKPDLSTNEIVAYLNWIIILLALFGMYMDLLPENALVVGLICVCLFINGGIKVFALFAEQEHTKRPAGIIEFELQQLTWNNRPIKWNDMQKISISTGDYRGRFTGGVEGYKNRQSAGLDNFIRIELNDKEIFQASMLIESKDRSEALNALLWEIVKANNISYQNAKRMVGPKNYKEHQDLKKLCG